MADEQPVTLKKRRVSASVPDLSSGGRVCIIHYSRNVSDTQVRHLTEHSFKTIRESLRIRQQQEREALRLDDICKKVPEQFVEVEHGCHRWCYCNFTNISKCTLKTDGTSTESSKTSTDDTARRSSRAAAASVDNSVVLFPADQCLFCDKGRKKVKRNRTLENLVTCVTETAERSIKEAAEEKADYRILGKIAGMDLRAREARYHESCRRSYVRDENREHHMREGSVTEEQETAGQKEQRAAYLRAFQFLCEYVEHSIIEEGNVERMTMLRKKYMDYIQTHTPEYYNDDYRTSKLKDRLISHFGDKINFWLPSRRYTSELVYAADLDTGEAVQVAYEATSSDSKILADAAAILRGQIENAHTTANETQWPPSAEDLKSKAKMLLPKTLLDFLALTLSGKPLEQSTDKVQRLCSSFAEDICSATTRGQWKVSKHLLLGLTLHHLTGSAEIVTLIHRYGHCASYTGVMELETAMATQVHQQDSVLPSNISTEGSKMIHMCWDNFDLNEETLSGGQTTHTTHGIAIQEVDYKDIVVGNTVSVPKSKKRSFQIISPTTLPAVGKKNAEPSVVACPSSEKSTPGDCGSCAESAAFEQLWSLARGKFNNSYTVPDWSGWLSKTCDAATLTSGRIPSKIGYMAPILHPITEFATVKKCLDLSVEVTKKLKQEYTLVTMDLAAAKIAYDIIWSSGDLYQKVIMNIGPFHTMCSYMGSLGKMMCESGFEDIVIEAGLCASGSIEQVMSGKHYNRAMRVHHRMLDALERMMLLSFDGNGNLTSEESLHLVSVLASDPTSSNLLSAAQSESCQRYLHQLELFKSDIRQGKIGKTAQFWMNYCDCVWTLLRFHRAVKENNLDLFLTSMRKMCDLLFSSDHLHYARYLPVYHTELDNLVKSQSNAQLLLQECGFSVARSAVPGCRIPVDQTIEQTINRSAKTSGGIVGFSRNPGAYQRWCLTRHKRAEYVETTLDAADMMDNMDAHKGTRKVEIRRSEMEVNRVIYTFDHFINPFSCSEEHHQQLFCLSSGQPASEAVTDDLCRFVEAGEKAASDFIQTRLVERSVKLHDKMKKQSLKTFRSMAVKVKMTSSKKKTIEVRAERNLLGNLLMLSQRQDICLERLFQYPLAPIPWSLATADGSLVKTNKSQIMHCIQALIEHQEPVQTTAGVFVIDGNALLQSLVRLPETFEDLAMCIFKALPSGTSIHFVTDTYIENSIKQLERRRRGSSATYLLGGSRTKLPRDFKHFLLNDDNKRQLIKFLLAEWQGERYARHLQGCEVFFVCETQCIRLSSEDGVTVAANSVQELYSNQEEADTRIILHCLYEAQRIEATSAIFVRSPDTDVFILLLHYSVHIQQPLMFDTGCGSNRRTLDVGRYAAELGPDVSEALPAFHAFTGSDCTSAFVNKGKKGPLKLLRQSDSALQGFKRMGIQASNLHRVTFSALEAFVCAMYGKPLHCSVNEVRCDIFRSRFEVKPHQTSFSLQKGVDISLLPPCRTSLQKHCQRVNYQTFIWKHAHVAQLQLPSPDGCGWKKTVSGELEIDWTEDALPQQLVEVLADREHEDEQLTEVYEEVEEDELDNIIDVVFDDEEEDDQ